MNSRVRKTFAQLLLSAALSGCASFHKKPLAAVPSPPDIPELSQTPLYSPAMSENTPRTPDLPAPSETAVVHPPPPPQKQHHVKKVKPVKASENTAAASAGAPGASSGAGVSDTPTPPAVMEKKPPALQASLSTAGSPAASPIGDLTAGSAADAAQTSHQADDLIRTTRDGVQGIKRPLSADEKKTVAEIWSFLSRADQAVKNGDVDGAYGLATKAKLLLDELTQK